MEVRLALPRGAVIAGTIRDQLGYSAPGVDVLLLRFTAANPGTQVIDFRFKPERALWGKGPRLSGDLRGARPGCRRNRCEFMRSRPTRRARSCSGWTTSWCRRRARPTTSPGDAGFAGLAIMETWLDRNWPEAPAWITFLGSSCFWADASAYVARGVALDVGGVAEEDRPDFTAHWLAGAPSPQAPLMVCSLLDGPSLAGAYRFHFSRSEAVVAEVEAHLFLRQNIDRLGIAPLGLRLASGPEGESATGKGNGLAVWTGEGGRIWRPLAGTDAVGTDRDRERQCARLRLRPPGRTAAGGRRPQPRRARDLGLDRAARGLGPGAGRAGRAGPGGEPGRRRHLLGRAAAGPRRREPYLPLSGALDRARAHVPGRAGPGEGECRQRGRGTDADGDVRDRLCRRTAGRVGPETAPEPVVSAARGEIVRAGVRLVPEGPARRWRLDFDLRAEPGEPIELRAFLRRGDNVLSETWLFHHRMHPA